MDDSLEAKQEYLRTQILDKGYDADNFMAFLQEKKGEDGVDLSNWNIAELKDAVSEFTSIYKPNEDENNDSNNNSQNDNNNNNNIIDNNNDDLEPVNMDLIKNAHIKEYNLCIKTEVTTLSTKKNIEISVGFPEKKEGGMFNKSFISYLVTTQQLHHRLSVVLFILRQPYL